MVKDKNWDWRKGVAQFSQGMQTIYKNSLQLRDYGISPEGSNNVLTPEQVNENRTTHGNTIRATANSRLMREVTKYLGGK
jgi:hypothetical protein